MAALDFPGTPTPNQVFASVALGLSWRWDSVKWVFGAPAGTTPVPPPAFLVVGASMTLPDGYAGIVSVENRTGAAIVITLPLAAPTIAQAITIKDGLGNAGTYTITIRATPRTIDGNPDYPLVSDFMSLDLLWLGTLWGSR